MDLLGTLGKLRRNLLGDDLPPAEKRAATVGTFGPGIATQMQEHGRTQRDLLGREGVGGMMRSPELARQSTDLAASLDLTGTFGGVFAKGADLGAHNMARRMKGEGKAAEEIWEQTGWFQGPDKKWRFEISDSTSNIRPMRLEDIQPGQSKPAEDVFGHIRLYDAYPELRKVAVDRDVSGGLLGVSRGGSIGLKTDRSSGQVRDTMLHELQHEIQNKEGFAKGGMPESAASQFYDDMNKRMSEIVRQKDRATGAEKQSLQDEYDRLMSEKMKANPVDLYRRLAGEAEARLVERRSSLTPAERRMLHPWLGYDVPPEQQIVRGVRD